MKRFHLLLFLAFAGPLAAQVPPLLNYQGRVAVSGVNFDGTGLFKFALVNATGSTTLWSNDGTSTAGSPPASAVALTVKKSLYSVLLGDVSPPRHDGAHSRQCLQSGRCAAPHLV